MISTAGVIAAIAVAQNVINREQEEEQEEEQQKQKKRQQRNRNALLLNRKGSHMKIEEKEKIEVFRLVHRGGYSYHDRQWFLEQKDNSDICSNKSLYLCLDEALSLLSLKEYELVPVSVDSHGEVDEFLLMAKVTDTEALDKENNLLQMAEKMSKDIESAW